MQLWGLFITKKMGGRRRWIEKTKLKQTKGRGSTRSSLQMGQKKGGECSKISEGREIRMKYEVFERVVSLKKKRKEGYVEGGGGVQDWNCRSWGWLKERQIKDLCMRESGDKLTISSMQRTLHAPLKGNGGWEKTRLHTHNILQYHG